jgi:hypothetical protein
MKKLNNSEQAMALALLQKINQNRPPLCIMLFTWLVSTTYSLHHEKTLSPPVFLFSAGMQFFVVFFARSLLLSLRLVGDMQNQIRQTGKSNAKVTLIKCADYFTPEDAIVVAGSIMMFFVALPFYLMNWNHPSNSLENVFTLTAITSGTLSCLFTIPAPVIVGLMSCLKKMGRNSIKRSLSDASAHKDSHLQQRRR